MENNYIDIILYILKLDRVVTSTELANHFNVSPRTIKTYISTLNKINTKTPIILSTNKGYSLNKSVALDFIKKHRDTQSDIPQNYNERIHNIIKRLFIDNESLNIFDLSQEMHVSESTIKSDITKFNSFSEKFNAKINIKKDCLVLIGNEKDLRKLISHILFDEIPNRIMTKDILNRNFNPTDVNNMLTALQPLFDNKQIRVNEFAFMNIILHLLILVTSVRHGRKPNKNLVRHEGVDNLLEDIKIQLVDNIQDIFNLTLSNFDITQIELIFAANINFIPTNKYKFIKEQYNEKIITALEETVSKIEQYYGLNLSSERFLFNFSIHLNNLYHRAKEKSFVKNPMTKLLKTSFPIVYDMSVFISVILSEKLNIEIVEDEVGYIALHIGSELENQKTNSKKITTTLICPNYMQLDEKLYLQLIENFDQLNIDLVTFDLDELNTSDTELIISTVPIDSRKLNNLNYVQIAPLFNKDQKFIIEEKIKSILKQKKTEMIHSNFSKFFKESLFFYDSTLTQREQTIKFLTEAMVTLNIVNDNFYDDVMERENASSTGFDKIAIPHSVYMTANKTRIAVLISKDGISWGDSIVNFVFLTAINYSDRESFGEVYEGLISVFDNTENLSVLQNTKTFREFEIFLQARIMK